LPSKESKNRIYSWHAPETECIAKGKVDKPYEFGCKVSVATNLNPGKGGHFVLHASAMHGRPYDGHTLARAINQVTALSGKEPGKIYVDRGYTGHNYENKLRVFKSGQKRGVTDQIKKELKRRTVIEPIIGHMKNDGRLGRNYLKGKSGDCINAVLAACGFNFRQILSYLRWLYYIFLQLLAIALPARFTAII
jgi:IS5 family transposase